MRDIDEERRRKAKEKIGGNMRAALVQLRINTDRLIRSELTLEDFSEGDRPFAKI
jgi:hypothetical protein